MVHCLFPLSNIFIYHLFSLQLSQRTISGSLLKFLSKLQVCTLCLVSSLLLTISYDIDFRVLGWTVRFQFLYSFVTQVDEEPAIRTNTTILLGNIASHLNDGVGTKSSILIILTILLVLGHHSWLKICCKADKEKGVDKCVHSSSFAWYFLSSPRSR